MIEKYNFHWKEGFFYNFPKQRKLFKSIANEIKSKQIISLIGIRRTGKTTILKQVIDQLIKTEKVKRENILFFSFDEEQIKIEEIVKRYETILGKSIRDINEKIYIFLDEIQKLENWHGQIKYFYDNYNNVKFFISGSASLFLRKQTQESLAGRIYEYVLNPLDFEEFLIFKNKEELIEKKNLFQDEIKKEFLAYRKRQFIEIVNETEEKAGQYVKSILEKVVFQDIPKIFPIENEELLLKILKIVASNPGIIVDYNSLANSLGINRITLSNYFYYLEESFLIKKLYNFSKNQLTSEKKMKRSYLTNPSFFMYLNNEIDDSKLIENLIISYLNAKFFWRTPQKDEVDIIFVKDKKIIPIEVKYRNSIVKKDFKGLIKFCDEFKIKEALMITKDDLGIKTFKSRDGNNIKITLIPSWKFVLEGIEDFI